MRQKHDLYATAMKYTAQQIASILGSDALDLPDLVITAASTDTRTITDGSYVVFFAITTANRSGLTYLADAAATGVRLVVADHMPDDLPDGVSLLLVDDTVAALQGLAAYHRRQFDIPVVAITGSYGKTIVKEWISTMLSTRYRVCKSPQSYNSQIGVPLSVLQLDAQASIAVFEVGVSRAGEMSALAEVVQPTHGIFTTIGPAHDAGFVDRTAKIKEKAILFRSCQQVVCNHHHREIVHQVEQSLAAGKVTTWSTAQEGDYSISIDLPQVQISNSDADLTSTTRLSSPPMLDNLMHAAVLALELGVPTEEVSAAMSAIGPLPMRLETSAGRQGSILINDTYTADIQSLRLALDYQRSLSSARPRLLILSDIDHSHGPWVAAAQQLITDYEIDHLITVGETSRQLIASTHTTYDTTEALLAEIDRLEVQDHVVLTKGARRYGMERVCHQLEALSHNARLEIDLAALQHNLDVYQRKAGCAMMVVIKASAYGTGSVEVARLLERRGVAYLAVAFVDEAITLRQGGIKMPILVLNPDLDRLTACWQNDIDIELHSTDQLDRITAFLTMHSTASLRVHLMLDTGMKRLGFEVDNLDRLREWLSREEQVEIVSVFSHLVASESVDLDDFTRRQMHAFDAMCKALPPAQYYHILNSSGIARHQGHDYNMARLGLGLYGIDTSATMTAALQPVHHLSARVLQVKRLAAGDSVGYGRSYVADRDMTICTVNVGYADGLMRSAAGGGFAFRAGNHLLPIVGSICMDLTMCASPDGAGIRVGDTVTVFGPDHPIDILAQASGTIPYEVLSRIAPRVKRVFHH